MFRAVSGGYIAVMLALCFAGVQPAVGHSPVRTQHATGRYRPLQRAASQRTAQDMETMLSLQRFAADELRHRRRRRLQQVASFLRHERMNVASSPIVCPRRSSWKLSWNAYPNGTGRGTCMTQHDLPSDCMRLGAPNATNSSVWSFARTACILGDEHWLESIECRFPDPADSAVPTLLFPAPLYPAKVLSGEVLSVMIHDSRSGLYARTS